MEQVHHSKQSSSSGETFHHLNENSGVTDLTNATNLFNQKKRKLAEATFHSAPVAMKGIKRFRPTTEW